jgi:predicted RNase H-like HicB family nuclease
VNAGKKVKIIQHCFIISDGDGASTQGEALDEARENLKEAVRLVLETNRQLAEESLAFFSL